MSKEAIKSFLRDVIGDWAFAAQVRTDPSVLNGYDLTLEEKRALREHDSDALLDLGVSPELLRGLDVLPLPDRSTGSR